MERGGRSVMEFATNDDAHASKDDFTDECRRCRSDRLPDDRVQTIADSATSRREMQNPTAAIVRI